MEPKYKVGDWVRIKAQSEIKQTLDKDANYKYDTQLVFVSYMKNYCGKVCKITDICSKTKHLRYQINNEYWFVEDWFEFISTSSKFSDKTLILCMCLQLLSGNRPNVQIFKDSVPFKTEGGFNWYEFQNQLSMELITDPTPNWPILTLDLEFAELLLTRMYKYPFSSLIDIDKFKKSIGDLIDEINWTETPEGFQFWNEKCQYYDSISDSEILKHQEQPYKTKNHEIKLQRKKSTVIRGTVPEGSITRGRKRKVTITVGHLSNSVCIGG